MRLNDLLNTPIVIGGQEVILIDDHIGDDNLSLESVEDLVEIEPSDGVSPGFYVNESQLLKVRTDFPGIKTFGLWQTIYGSGLLKGHEYLFIPFNEGSGRYARLYQQDGLWIPVHSGIVTGGDLSDDAGLTVSDTKELSFDPQLLVVPGAEALLLREHQARLEKRSRKRYWAAGVACLAVVVLTGIIETALTFQYRWAEKEMADLRAEERELNERIGKLTRTRLLRQPDYSTQIKRVFLMYSMDPQLATGQSSTFSGPIYLLMNRDTLPLVRSIEWVIPSISGEGSILLSVPAREET